MNREPTTLYSLASFNSTDNPATIDKADIIYYAIRLASDLGNALSSNRVAIPSRDQDESLRGIEIVVWYPTGSGPGFDVAKFLTDRAASLNLKYRSFVGGDVKFREYTPKQIKNIMDAKKPLSAAPTITKTEIEALINYNASAHSPEFDGIQNISEAQLNKTFLISPLQVETLKHATGDVLEKRIKEVLASRYASVTGNSKTGLQTLEGVGSGVITVASGAQTFFKSSLVSAAGSVLGYFAATGASAGAAAASPPVAAVIAGIILEGTFYLLMKDAMNVLLVINNTLDDVICRGDHIAHGERVEITPIIPAKTNLSDTWVCVGLYQYRKFNIKGNSFGTYGPMFGTGFTRNKNDFVVAMDCPNSAIGGTNTIWVEPGLNAAAVAWMLPYLKREETVHSDNKKTTVRRTNRWGNINWGIAMIE